VAGHKKLLFVFGNHRENGQYLGRDISFNPKTPLVFKGFIVENDLDLPISFISI